MMAKTEAVVVVRDALVKAVCREVMDAHLREKNELLVQIVELQTSGLRNMLERKAAEEEVQRQVQEAKRQAREAQKSQEALQAELDTCWVQKGGEDPVAWCRKMKGRLPLLHLKDYVVNLEREILFGEVGIGSLDWDSIIQEADAAGCEWFIVEQDSSTRDPFESIKMSFDFLMQQTETLGV